LQAVPVGSQLNLMQFSPRLDQTPLLPGQRTRDQIYGVNTEDAYFILAVCVEMSGVMG
jgi:hypothetical protein